MLLKPKSYGGGTGFHIQAPSGKFYIMTNRHVCEAAEVRKDGVYMEVADGYTIVERRVISISAKHDLCILEPLHDSGITRIGEAKSILPVITSGYGRLNPITSSVGFQRSEHIAHVCMEASFFGCTRVERFKTHAYTMIVVGGHSGSPIIDPLGRLVGVIFAGDRFTSLAVPAEYVKEFLQDK
jgi:S1-C subfamily serine protease